MYSMKRAGRAASLLLDCTLVPYLLVYGQLHGTELSEAGSLGLTALIFAVSIHAIFSFLSCCKEEK